VKVTVNITKSFSSAAKPLLKKYHSFSKDLLALEKELLSTPKLGTPLGYDAYTATSGLVIRRGDVKGFIQKYFLMILIFTERRLLYLLFKIFPPALSASLPYK
jgi:hypothetical protein